MLAILEEQPQALHALVWPDDSLPVLLADPSGSTRRAYEAVLPVVPQGQALVFVLDRFGAPYAAFASNEPDAPELQKEVQGWLAYIGIQCPE